MAIAVESEPLASREQIHPSHALAALGALGWLAVGGAASLGAGAIHAAAIGVHSEHRQAVMAFTVVAAIQLAWGALVLARALSGTGQIILAEDPGELPAKLEEGKSRQPVPIGDADRLVRAVGKALRPNEGV